MSPALFSADFWGAIGFASAISRWAEPSWFDAVLAVRPAEHWQSQWHTESGTNIRSKP
jgi:hypothetical protein